MAKRKRYMVYVDVPVVTMQRTAFVVLDEDDLANQMAKREADLQADAPKKKCKPDRDKKDKIVMFQLGEGWDV